MDELLTKPAEAPTPRQILDEEWQRALDNPGETDEEMDSLMRDGTVAIRYGILTQLLGKIVNPEWSATCLKKGKSSTSDRWSPRGFCKKWVVPWAQDNENVIGTSPDPYVSNPMRKLQLDGNDESIKEEDKHSWRKFVSLMEAVETNNSSQYTRNQFQRCLKSVARIYRSTKQRYTLPTQISAEETNLIVHAFLAEDEGGFRHQAVTAAILRAFGQETGMFSRVDSLKINTADAARGTPGDALCYKSEALVLAAEVKDRTISIVDLESTFEKVRQSETNTLLLLTRKIQDPATKARIEGEFQRGIDTREASVEEIVRVAIALASEQCRIKFLKEVGKEIDEKAPSPKHKKAWSNALKQQPKP